MTDDQQKPPDPAPQAPVTPPDPPLPTTPIEYPTNFGQQVAAKGGLPPDLETRSRDIEKGE